MKTIPLTQGQVALIDDADFEIVSQFKWHAIKKGYTFYAARSVKKFDGKWKRQYLHNFLMPGVPRVDHRDGNGLNNQRTQNLRPATHKQNNQGFKHKRPEASSRFRGVSWNTHCRKWEASISVDRNQIHLGLFTAEEDAARAYDAAAIKYFGDFASLNFKAA